MVATAGCTEQSDTWRSNWGGQRSWQHSADLGSQVRGKAGPRSSGLQVRAVNVNLCIHYGTEIGLCEIWLNGCRASAAEAAAQAAAYMKPEDSKKAEAQ